MGSHSAFYLPLRCAGRGLRSAARIVTTGTSSPAWHRRQRRARAKSRATLAACDRLLTPRALQAIDRLQQHHGSSVPDLSRAIYLDQLSHLPVFAAVAWCCPVCNASNWNTRSNCYRCHCSVSEPHTEWQPQAQPRAVGQNNQGLTFLPCGAKGSSKGGFFSVQL